MTYPAGAFPTRAGTLMGRLAALAVVEQQHVHETAGVDALEAQLVNEARNQLLTGGEAAARLLRHAIIGADAVVRDEWPPIQGQLV